MNKFQIIVAHPGKQHSFYMATAIKNAGWLYKYITIVYYKKSSLTKLITDHLLKGQTFKKAKSRECKELLDSEVEQLDEWKGLVTLLLSRIANLDKFARLWNVCTASSFYKKVMKIVKKNKTDVVIVYDGYSDRHLDLITESNIIKIMDVSFASRQYLKQLFNKEIKEYGVEELKRTSLELWNDRWMKNDLMATKNTDYFFAPSNFVKKSLEYCGVEPNKIYIIPYGVDTNKFVYKETFYNPNDKLKLLYVGEISYRKGLHRLLKIVSKYPDSIQLKLCGHIDKSLKLYEDYKGEKNIEFLGFVTHDQLSDEYTKADVFVFPTLGEGYGLVVLEALSCGLPVICSDRAGGNDVIQEGVNGFVISMDTNIELENRIIWSSSHRKELYNMRKAARESVRNLSWDTYNRRVKECLVDILKKENKWK